MKINIKFIILSYLVIFNNSLDCKSLKHILNSGKYPLVESQALDLSNLGLTDIKGISKYPDIKKVKILILRDNKLRSIQALSDIDVKHNLEALDIASNDISDISVLTKFTNLKQLYIEHNNVDETGLRDLIENLTKLKSLYVDGNPINDPVYKYNFEVCERRNLNYFEIFPYTAEEQIENVIVQQVWPEAVNDACPICLEDDKNNMIALKCLHMFHRKCIKEAIKKSDHARCPMCRVNLED